MHSQKTYYYYYYLLPLHKLLKIATNSPNFQTIIFNCYSFVVSKRPITKSVCSLMDYYYLLKIIILSL